ncbi:hypothetical protein V5O48_019463, partial [Marasmius crinis-equi]
SLRGPNNPKLPASKDWPFCFRCWVPLCQPCGHPPPEPNARIDPSKCSFKVPDHITHEDIPIIPWMITLIYSYQNARKDGKEYHDPVCKALGVNLVNIRDLRAWLVEPVTELAQVPNHIRYIVAFYDTCRKLKDV